MKAEITDEEFKRLLKKLDPDDKLGDGGAMPLMIAVKDDTIFLRFSKAVTQVGLPPHGAYELAAGLMEASKKIVMGDNYNKNQNTVTVVSSKKDEVKLIYDEPVIEHVLDAETAVELAQSMVNAAGVAASDSDSIPDFHSNTREQ